MSCQIKFRIILKSLFHKAHCMLIPEKNVTNTVLSRQMSMVSCHKGPTRHAYAWQIGPFLAGYHRCVYGFVMLYFELVLLLDVSFGLWVLWLLVSVSVCLSVCVNHLLIHKITCDLFKLGLPNLDQRCKAPWLRSPLCWKAIDLDLQGQI